MAKTCSYPEETFETAGSFSIREKIVRELSALLKDQI
jgi:hypothetical protein